MQVIYNFALALVECTYMHMQQHTLTVHKCLYCGSSYFLYQTFQETNVAFSEHKQSPAVAGRYYQLCVSFFHLNESDRNEKLQYVLVHKKCGKLVLWLVSVTHKSKAMRARCYRWKQAVLSGRKLWLLLFGDLLRFMSDMQQSNAADHMLDVKNMKGMLTKKTKHLGKWWKGYQQAFRWDNNIYSNSTMFRR